MDESDILRTSGNVLCMAAELGFFNQWLFFEPESGPLVGVSAPVLVTLYAICELLSRNAIKNFGQDLPILQASILFLPHLVCASISTLIWSAYRGSADSRKPVDQTKHEQAREKKEQALTNASPAWYSGIGELIALGIPTATAAFSNVLLLHLVQRESGIRDPSLPALMAYGYAAFLASRIGDYVVGERMGRPLFIGQGGLSQLHFAVGALAMLLIIRILLSWVFDQQIDWPLQEHVVKWFQHTVASHYKSQDY